MIIDSEKIIQHERSIMKDYIDSSKIFIQLGLGALVFSITFIEKIIGNKGIIHFSKSLTCSWVFWLLSVLFGGLYQYFATRYLEDIGEYYGLLKKSERSKFLSSVAKKPEILYALMLGSFFLGCSAFAIFGIKHMVK